MQKTQAPDFITEYDSFSRIIHNSGVSLINFGVPWSVACNIQNNIACRVASIFNNDVMYSSVDIENIPRAKTDFDIHNVPTVVILKDGAELKRFLGVQPERTLAKELNDVTGFYVGDREVDIEWEEILDREKEKMLLHKEILVIDDDPDITFCVITILEEARFDNTAIANSYESTIEHLNKSVPDLIFLNISMSNKDGNKILMALRRNKKWNSIPILVSVGPLEPTRVYEDSFREAAILKHGKYVEHPSTRDSFISLVRHMLLYEEQESESQVLNIGSICPPDRKGM